MCKLFLYISLNQTTGSSLSCSLRSYFLKFENDTRIWVMPNILLPATNTEVCEDACMVDGCLYLFRAKTSKQIWKKRTQTYFIYRNLHIVCVLSRLAEKVAGRSLLLYFIRNVPNYISLRRSSARTQSLLPASYIKLYSNLTRMGRAINSGNFRSS